MLQLVYRCAQFFEEFLVLLIFETLEKLAIRSQIFIFQNISRNTNLFKSRGEAFVSDTNYYLPTKIGDICGALTISVERVKTFFLKRTGFF